MGCILTNQHTSHSIIGLKEADQSLRTMVREKFDTDVAESIGKLKEMMDGVQEKSDQLKSFGDELVKTIEAAFEEVFVCLKRSYTTLL